jgi:hypothetical protein
MSLDAGGAAVGGVMFVPSSSGFDREDGFAPEVTNGQPLNRGLNC